MARTKPESSSQQQTTATYPDQEQLVNKQACCESIRDAAYFRWEAAGCPCGDGVEFWLEAEAEILANTSGADESQNR